MNKAVDSKASRNYLFGARAMAAGLYKALRALCPQISIDAFLVSKKEGNIEEIWGCPVKALSDICAELSDGEKNNVRIYAAVPELIHKEIRELLNQHGFRNLVMMDSYMEADIMGAYFSQEGTFKSVHDLKIGSHITIPKLTIYAASFYKDQLLAKPPRLQHYIKKLYLGCAGAIKESVDIKGQADFYDNIGDNISSKNPLRCEMTAHYWIWKNRLGTDDEYVGVCHYRRMLDLTDDDLKRMKQNDVDVVLPYPMLHYPDAKIHHTWYVPEKDWDLLVKIVNELYPEYGEKLEEVFSAPAFYNYNIMLAKKKVFADYCAWIYPILDRIEELSEPKGADRGDRYTAYLSESLTTLYFMMNKQNLDIYHTGRLLFT